MGPEALLLLAVISQPVLELPWPCGQTVMCTQGHGGFSHNDGSYYAWDFDLNVGEEVWAAASGSVSHIRMSGSTGCCDPSCSWDANYVVVNHGDGTEAMYMHLQQWSSSLSVGDWVDTGDLVGRIGLTGYVCGDHLHFAVQSDCASYYCTTIPGTFYDYGDPGYGDWLTSGNCPAPDNDGDGYNENNDCDDGNASVHPGAAEVCDDGLDNDCSGGDLASETWYDDDDGDGWGGDDVYVCGSPPGGTVSAGGDCDDGDDTIHPDAAELCDGKDNDCDGEVDDGNPTVMGDPPLPYAAVLEDVSYPAALLVGEVGTVWFAFTNVGGETWSAGDVRLVAESSFDGVESPLQDPGTWPAWDVLALLDVDVLPGDTGWFEGVVRAPDTPGHDAVDAFRLAHGSGEPMTCPSTVAEVAVVVQLAQDPDLDPGEDATDPASTGCTCTAAPGGSAAPWAWLLLGWAGLLRRRPRHV